MMRVVVQSEVSVFSLVIVLKGSIVGVEEEEEGVEGVERKVRGGIVSGATT